MKLIRPFAFPVAAAVLALAMMIHPAHARAAELTAADAGQLGATLASAYFTSTQLSRQLGTEKGGFSKLFKVGLAALEKEMTNAERLAGGHPALEPGIRHVRDNHRKIAEAGKVTRDSATLLDEIGIELYALVVNANILESVAHLNDAKTALADGRNQAVMTHLQAAGKALENANNRGAYHIQNDLEEIQAALLTLAGQVGGDTPIKTSAIDERIAEIESHLFDVGQEHK